MVDRVATTGAAGTRKARGRSGRLRRRITTPMLTRMNAKSVPMLTRLASSVRSTKPEMRATAVAVTSVIR